jgi:hypothetical protein
VLQATLFPTNPMLHPGIMYAFWSRQDGKPLEQRPVFYEGVSLDSGLCLALTHDIVHRVDSTALLTRGGGRERAQLSVVPHLSVFSGNQCLDAWLWT